MAGRKIAIALLVATLVVLGGARNSMNVDARIIDGIFMTVDGEAVTFSEFRDFVAKRLGLSPGDADAFLRKVSAREKIEPFIEEFLEVMLVRHKLKELGEEVKDEEVDGVIRNIMKVNDLTEEQFQKVLENEGLSFDAYREKLREDMEKSRIVRAMKGREVLVTDDEVREYYLSHKERFSRGFDAWFTLLSFRIEEGREKLGPAGMRELVVKLEAAAEEEGGLGGVKEVLEDAGIEYDVSAVGPVKPDDVRGEMRGVLEELMPNEVSRSILVGDRLAFVRMEKKEGGETVAFDEVKERIREELVNRRSLAAIREIIAQLKKESYVEVRP